MRSDILFLCSLCILTGYGNAFQITDFLSTFSEVPATQRQHIAPSVDQLTERQDGGTAATILAVFIIAFGTSVLTNLIFLSTIQAAPVEGDIITEKVVQCGGGGEGRVS